MCGDIYPKDGKIIWLNTRQEPNVYANGEPMCARPPNKIGEFVELDIFSRDELKAQEVAFKKVLADRVEKNDKKIKYQDVNKRDYEVPLKSDLKSLSEVIEDVKKDFPGLVHLRVPIGNSPSPSEAAFDIITGMMVGTCINTPIIVSDQLGLTRATTACVIACLFKEFQISASFEGLIETVPGVNSNCLKMDNYVMDPTKDPLFRGEFPVVAKLLEKLKDGKACKNECDKVIDKNGPKKTGGSGIKQIRENIAESKLSYEIMDDAAQAFLKQKIMDNIQKYFYLIVFTAYIREAVVMCKESASEEDKKNFSLTGGKVSTPADQLKLQKTFVQFMEEHSELRTLVEEGKGRLQWERDIPADALANLESLAAQDFKGNLGKIIHDIYQTAHGLFRDLPQV